MKKELTMTTAMAAALLALPGCSSNDGWDEDYVASYDTALCVDQAGRRVPDSHCDNYGGGSGGGASWYYLGRNSRIPFYGESIREGRFAGQGSYSQPAGTYFRAPAETSMTRSQAISRGGLGSSSRMFGGGRS